jgi:hypothetical protein
MEERDLYGTPEWAKLDRMLAEKFQSAADLVMKTEDFEQLKVARVRARLISELRKRPEDVELQLQGLFQELRVLRGEEESPEEE